MLEFKVAPQGVNWCNHKFATELALANLIGSWDENNNEDIACISKIVGEDYHTWIIKIREIMRQPNSPLNFFNGYWKIQAKRRRELWDELGSCLFNVHLTNFETSSVKVLRELDPAFELAAENRYAAHVYGKTTLNSSSLRKGLTGGLALLGSKPELLINCSQSKRSFTANRVIRELFIDSNWVLWASLNGLLVLEVFDVLLIQYSL